MEKAPSSSSNELQDDEYIASLQKQIQSIKLNREMEARYMLLEEMLKDERQAGWEAGNKDGSQKTLTLLNLLAKKLAALGRTDELTKALEDL